MWGWTCRELLNQTGFDAEVKTWGGRNESGDVTPEESQS
jgi:hypothetical protein